jgi:hypothetical protein
VPWRPALSTTRRPGACCCCCCCCCCCSSVCCGLCTHPRELLQVARVPGPQRMGGPRPS